MAIQTFGQVPYIIYNIRSRVPSKDDDGLDNFSRRCGLQLNEERVSEQLAMLQGKMDVYDRILSKQKYLAGGHMPDNDSVTLADLSHLPYGTAFYDRTGFAEVFDSRPNLSRQELRCQLSPAWPAVKETFEKQSSVVENENYATYDMYSSGAESAQRALLFFTKQQAQLETYATEYLLTWSPVITPVKIESVVIQVATIKIYEMLIGESLALAVWSEQILILGARIDVAQRHAGGCDSE
ncbi:hypothetical protein EDB19DRAFT_1827694 [Suillus lakei]|nr:hypothetical protein EDB19DRAFT_1827694 [Suillus lakei]